MADLYTLSYVSKSLISSDTNKLEQQLANIIAVAQRNNAKRAVTGALLFSGNWFCQVIEGTEQALEQVFDAIQQDTRHTDINVLRFEQANERVFRDWNMVYVGKHEDLDIDIEGVMKSKDRLKMYDAGKALVSSLESLLDDHEKNLGQRAG